MRNDLQLALNILVPLFKIVVIVKRLREVSPREEVEDINKIIKFLDNLGILIKGYIKIIQIKKKEYITRVPCMSLVPLVLN